MEFILSQTQTQVINRDVLQHVKILQMSGAELLEFVREIALENPVMEVEEPEEEPVSEDIERIKKLDWLSNYDEGYLYRQKDGDSDEFDITSYAKPVEATLADSLYQQLIGKPYSDQEFRIFFYIIHSLDSNGFFTVSPQEAAEQLSVPLAELERCLAAVKQLEPAGVCAGNLSECLYLQLERMNDDSLDVEKEIVLHHLSLLGKNHLNVIANRLNQPVSRIQLAKKRVQALNPRPASGFSSGEATPYLIPDITVSRDEDRLTVQISRYVLPKIRYNKSYMQLLQSDDCLPDVRKYLTDKVQQIKKVQSGISKRCTTMTRVVNYILERQTEFFLHGPGMLRPMYMIDAARCLAMHESTVSRAVSGKYLQCDWGVYPLGYFFTKGVGVRDAGGDSSDRIQKRLSEIIRGEDRLHPLSDQKLADLLTAEGMPIARRTVAKYREGMQIADCRGRKAFPGAPGAE